MTDKAVYKTTDPEAVEAWQQWDAAYDAHHARMRTLRTETGIDGWHINAWTGEVLGPDKDEADVNIPDGWTALKTYEWLKPIRGSAGDAARAQLDRVGRQPTTEDLARKVGVPPILVGGGRFLRPGFAHWNGTVYLTWSRDPGEQFDPGGRWEPCTLSEFYAAKESHEAAGVTS